MLSVHKYMRILGLALALVLVSSWVYAAEPVIDPAATTVRDPLTTPGLAAILKFGAKAYYLGHRAGMDGWLILKDHQMQIGYTLGDTRALLLGALFSDEGDNITLIQVQSFLANNKDVAASIAGLGDSNTNAPSGATPTTGAPAAAPYNTIASAVKLSPGEKLLQSFEGAHGVILGSNAAAPELYMVMDPNCPHCQATWRALRDSVFSMKLRLHFIPIGETDSDNERAAAVLLSSPDPLNAWDRYVAGDKTSLMGTPAQALVTGVRANRALVDAWGIHITPYLAYRGKDGKVKVLQGEPDKISAVLSDLL